MKKYFIILSAIFPQIFMFLACDKNPISFSLEAVAEFSTEPRAHTILVDEEYGFVYVANSNPSHRNNSQKIQIFDKRGNYLKTLVDFGANPNGSYARYEPVDMTIDSDHNLDILVKPYRKDINESWFPYEGFCIMKYHPDGSFEAEFDFAQFETEWRPSAIGFHNEFIFVTNGKVLLKISKDGDHHFEIPLPINQDIIGPPITDMGIDSKGNIWLVGQAGFADTSVGCHITRLDPTSTSFITFYSKGKTKNYAALANNPGITLDKDDNIYLATFYCQSLEIFNRDGKFLNQIEIRNEDNGLPIDVAVDNQRNIFVLDNLNDLVRIFKHH